MNFLSSKMHYLVYHILITCFAPPIGGSTSWDFQYTFITIRCCKRSGKEKTKRKNSIVRYYKFSYKIHFCFLSLFTGICIISFIFYYYYCQIIRWRISKENIQNRRAKEPNLCGQHGQTVDTPPQSSSKKNALQP